MPQKRVPRSPDASVSGGFSESALPGNRPGMAIALVRPEHHYAVTSAANPRMSTAPSIGSGVPEHRHLHLAPRHWPTWLGIGVLRLVELLPYRLRNAFGAALGELAYRLPFGWVRIARRNIQLCFPEESAQQHEHLLHEHLRSLGMGVAETAVTFWSSNARIAKLAKLEGLEHVEAALKLGKGVILVGGHFTTIEIATRVLGTRLAVNVLYRPPKNEVIAEIYRQHFPRYAQRAIRHDDIRAVARALRQNGIVWYAPDQSFKKKGAAMVPFFGIDAATTTYTTRIAQLTGATVLTYFPQRLPGSQGYRMVIGPPVPIPGDSAVTDSLHFNQLLEAHIRKVPEQYLWIHRRFKGLEEGYPNYYGRDGRKN
jgi:KDO2-lipid IV(A) lauroyltransferase